MSTLNVSGENFEEGVIKKPLFHHSFFRLQKSDKGQIFYWSTQTALGSGGCRLSSIGCNHAQKTSKLPYFRLFRPDTQILSALTALYWPSNAFYWPSTTGYQPVPTDTDLVPSWIKHYRLILTQCHQVPTATFTTLYWLNTTKFQRLMHSLPRV